VAFWSGSLEFIRAANVAKVVIVVGIPCTTFLIAFLIAMWWATITRETIKLGPLEISAPESEQMKACRTIQAALHDEIQTLDNERMSAYKTIDNDQTALNEETRLRVDARERDIAVSKETGSSSSANEYGVTTELN
jgi:hypothetical protein